MKKQLTEEEKRELLPLLHRVLETDETWENETMHHPAGAIIDLVLSIPGIERAPLENGRYGLVGFDTNGWQWDWWQDFMFQGKRYTLGGSGYHGGHAFHLADEQEK